jgi:origin recognition complex subunit 5
MYYLVPFYALATLLRLTHLFERESPSVSDVNPYNSALFPLYSHFCSILYSICSPFTHDPDELAYISAARWPGFAQPVLDEHRQQLDLQQQQREGAGMGNIVHNSELKLVPPTEETRIRLTRLFTPTLTAALEALYPRLTSASSWARDKAPELGLLALPPARASPLRPKPNGDANAVDTLPRMSKFILIAAFLASTNPAKTDLRMFGRGLDESKKKRRKGGPRKGSGKSSVAKVGTAPLKVLSLAFDLK